MRELERAFHEAEVRGLRDRVSLPMLLERYPGRRGTRKLRALLEVGGAGGVHAQRLRGGVPGAGRRLRLAAAADERRPGDARALLRDRCALGRRAGGGGARQPQRPRHAEGSSRDRQRDRILVAEGWRTMRVTWRQLQEEPEEIAAICGGALGRAAPTPTWQVGVGPALRISKRFTLQAWIGSSSSTICATRAGVGRRPRAPSRAPPVGPPAAISRGSRSRSRTGGSGRVTFDAEGCGATRAATAAVAEMVDGEPVLDAALIDIDDVDAAIGGLTPAKRHAAQLATDALHRALARRRRVAPSGSPTPARRPRRRRDVRRRRQRRRRAARARGGAEVVGVTVKLWADPETDGAKACCSPEAVLGARALAHSLGIPHFTLDLEEDFRRRVVDRFISGYAAGSDAQPLHPLQRRGAARGDGRPRRAARRRAPADRPLRAHRRGRATGRCSPPPPTRPRTRATCSRRCRPSCSTASASRSPS